MMFKRWFLLALSLLMGGVLLAQAPPPPRLLLVSVDPATLDVTMKWKDTVSILFPLESHLPYKCEYPIANNPPLALRIGPPVLYPATSTVLPLATGTMVNLATQGFCLTAKSTIVTANESQLTDYHFTMFLSNTPDTCKMNSTLKWTRYKATNQALVEQAAVHKVFNNAVEYEVWGYKDNGLPFNVATAQPLSGRTKDTVFVTPQLVAKTTYHYFIKAYLPNGEISTSNKSDAYVNSTAVPSSIVIQKLDANDTSIALTFTISSDSELNSYDIERSENPSQGFSSIQHFTSKSQTTYTDSNVNTAKTTYYYRVTASKCNSLVVVSDTTNNIILSCQPNVNTIESVWTPFHKTTKTYSVHRVVPDNIIAASSLTDTAYTDNVSSVIQQGYERFCYRIEGISNSGSISLSPGRCVIVTPQVNMPDALDPTQTIANISTGRQRNQFGPIVNMPDTAYGYKLTIHNRWGTKVFETTKAKGKPITSADLWDGKYKGKMVPPDMFIYTVTVYFSNKEVTKKGTVTVVY